MTKDERECIDSDPDQISLTLHRYDVDTIMSALYQKAGELASFEARRTGGRGYASGNISGQIRDLHRLYDQIKAARDAK